jgi:peptidoglycan/xylan/chitin deacetylase (PgdA/CDA1 family)/glycosyltransferase involved in cell wall biosynthesis/MoaA/NifB/PqqE/SkfB family radical SAM enzyme
VSSLPGIAVVIPCYDLGRTLEEAVDSVLAQTRPAAEIVVVDDGSADVLTRQVLARLDPPRTRVVRLAHAGVAAARNHGVALTRAPYVVLLDADDVLADRYLERLAARLDAEPALGFVSCAVQAFEGARYVWKPPSTTAVGTLTRGSVHVSSMFRRSLWDAVGGFDRELPAYEDLDFWLHALRLGFRGDVLDEPLLFYRVRAGSRYRRGVEADTYRRAMARIVERHRAVLDTGGTEVLAEKESFLLELTRYHDELRERHATLQGELDRLDAEIAAARRALGEAAVAPAAEAPAPWPSSPLRRSVEAALAERRWLVRGRVAVLADRPWALGALVVPRWDEGGPGVSEERWPLEEAGRLAAGSVDCAVVVLLAPAERIEDALARVVPALKPGGALLVAAAAATGGRVAEDEHEPAAAETWLRSTLARLVAPEAFDVSAPVAGVVAAYARVPGGAALPRLHFARRTAPGARPPGGLVLGYHRVADLTPDTHRLCVSPAHFREHVRYLRERCTPMPLVDLLLAARAGALPPRAVAVTLDDGYLDALTTAAPILAEAGVPATFFVNTERLTEPHEAWHDTLERILLDAAALPPRLELALAGGPVRHDVRTADERREAHRALHARLVGGTPGEREEILAALARWAGVPLDARPVRRVLLANEILALSRVPGCDIGSHSEHHLLLPHHPEAVQVTELRRAKEQLEALLDRSVLSLAYPFGQHSAGLEAVARRTPHLVAVTVEPGLVTAATEAMRVPRLEVVDGDGSALAAAIERAFAAVVRPAAGEASDAAWADNDRRLRRELGEGRLVLSARPQFVIIDPSSRCNARCVMCPVSFRAPGDRGVDLAPAVFDAAAALIPTATQVNLFSSGEPTIARDIEHVVTEARRRRDHRTTIWLSTNGKRLPERVLETVMAPGMGLQFSVDGGSKEVFEAIRRGIGFDELCHSLDLVQRRKGALPYPALSFSSTMSKRNLHDLANIFRLARRYGVEHVYFYDEDPEVPEEEPFVLDASDRPLFEAQLPAIEATGVRYSNGLTFRGPSGLRAVNPPPPAPPPTLRCRAPWSVFHLRADGSVRTCCTLRTSMGDLSRQTFEEIWNGEAYVSLRRAFVEQSGIPATCYRCADPLRTWGADPPPA